MEYSPQNAAAILQMLEGGMKEDLPLPFKVKKLWWTFLSCRAQTLTNALHAITGNKVNGGPFKDMALTPAAIDAYRAPILLGSYEQELHPVFEKIIATNYTRLLNIGCSVGYYAVGLARRMPYLTIEAFDTDAKAREKCAAMAEANGVSDRIRISGQFNGEDFAKYTDGKTLVLMDIEGGEKSLLDPAKYPALQKMDVVVELHDLLIPGISDEINARFAGTHAVEVIPNRNILPEVAHLLPPSYYLDPFDQLLLGWEGRDGKTPWGIYKAKAQ